MDFIRTKENWFLIALLLFASIVACSIAVMRQMYTGRTAIPLIWNLFLAWIPLGIAVALRLRKHPSMLTLLVLGSMWLLFFPNAPYLLTDIAEIRQAGFRTYWYELSMYLSFALAGLFVGYTSLTWMHVVVREKLGEWLGWLFVMVALASSGFGVYIGRFMRFNSWDALTDPRGITAMIADQLFSRATFVHTWSLSLTFGFLIGFCYLAIMLLNPPTKA